MINEMEVPIYVEKAIPGLSEKMLAGGQSHNIYQMMHVLLEHTHNNIEKQDMGAVKKCFKIAEKLYNKGSELVKNAVENVYVYSFSKIFHDRQKAQAIMGLMPLTLYSLYIRQMLHSNL